MNGSDRTFQMFVHEAPVTADAEGDLIDAWRLEPDLMPLFEDDLVAWVDANQKRPNKIAEMREAAREVWRRFEEWAGEG